MADIHYPRPDMERDRWLSLDGTWEFEFGSKVADANRPMRTLRHTITVPFCIESDAGGIGVENPPPLSWYAKTFRREDLPPGKRFFLNFGAVDHEATVWLNGILLGSHRGGYTPFTFEITDQLTDTNRLVVKVEDPRSWGTLRGKQYLWKRLSPVFYTPVSGIWQPVHIYATGNSRIKDLGISTTMNSISLNWTIDRGEHITIDVTDKNGTMVSGDDIVVSEENGNSSIILDHPHLWSFEDPFLYTVVVSLHDTDGESDRLVSYAGLRLIEAKNGRFFLNDNPIYLKMLLIQGYYPGGHYTPTDGAAGYERDILLIKGMGFNGIRVHQKIEDPRFLHLCDRHGLLVWAEMPSPFLFGTVRKEQFEQELREMLDRDSGHPSIMAVVLFNETWGIFDLLWSAGRKKYIPYLYDSVKEHRPHVLIVDNSGYDHVVTDIADIHHYLADEKKTRRLYDSLGDPGKMTMRFFKIPRAFSYLVLTHRVARKPYLSGGTYRGSEPFVVSEFGGAGFYKTDKNILESFIDNIRIMKEYPAIAGYCLTQAYDVEQERNGLLTFRREPKYPVEEIARVNAIIPG